MSEMGKKQHASTCLNGVMGFYSICLCLWASSQHVYASSDIISVRPHWQAGHLEGSTQSRPHYYLALHPHNLSLLCVSLKASKTWASAVVTSVFNNTGLFKAVQYRLMTSQLSNTANFPHAMLILNRRLYLPIAPMSVPPPSPCPSSVMDLTDLAGP